MNVGDRSLRVKVVMPFLFIALLTSGVFSAIAASGIPAANDIIDWFNMVIQLLGGSTVNELHFLPFVWIMATILKQSSPMIKYSD